MNLRSTICFSLLAIATPFYASSVEATATWCGNLQSLPGSSWSLQVLSSDASGTRVRLDCPGFWLEVVNQAGENRQKVVLPTAGVTTSVDLPELPAIGKLFIIPPDRAVEIIIHQVDFQTFSCDQPYLAEPIEGATPSYNLPATPGDVYPAAWSGTSTPGILKDHRVAPVNFYPVRYDFVTRELLLATRLEIEVRTVLPSTENVKTFFTQPSEAFEPLYESSLANRDAFNTAVPLVSEGPRGKYMIFVNQIYQTSLYLDSLTTWKRQLGYQVVLKTTPNLYTEGNIKADIMAEYYKGDAPLDYVLLIGDATGTNAIPTSTISRPGGGEVDPTDHPYTMLEGQDYFPDVMIGRISISTSSNLNTALAKILYYQRDPLMTTTAWFKEALVAAGNYSDILPIPITPAWTSLWLMEKLYDYGYTQVDTVIYWGPGSTWGYPGTTEIETSINSGVGLVAYRGWADESGWQYPVFDVDNINELTNGKKLPIVASIVCETGNYTDPSDPCFGEAWIRFGTPTTPKGGAAFYGPSDLHTNTKWNNALYAGFFEGLLEENLYRIGQAVVRSKLELYYGFPEDTDPGEFTEFYFHTYNILGDPELSIWTDVPALLTLDLPPQIQPGRQFVEIQAKYANGSPLGGAYVAFYKPGEILTGTVTDGEGYASAEVEPTTEGAITVTVSKQNCKPKMGTIPVAVGSFPLGLSQVAIGGDGTAQAGETFDLTLTVHNYGTTTISGLTATLSDADPFTIISNPIANLGDLAGQSGTTATYSITLDATTPNEHTVDFTLTITDGPNTVAPKFVLPLGGVQLLPVDLVEETGSLEPGSTAQVRLYVCNIGTIPAQGLNGTLSCGSGAVTITQNQSAFPVLLPNATGASSSLFMVQINSAAMNGSQVIFTLAVTAAGGFTQTINLPVQLGQPATTDPLGPDSYGYYAYDNTDQSYAPAPNYQWIELDQDTIHTYPGVLHALSDDESESLHLPFTFTYYGQDYDSLSICSNGYVSFHDTWMAEFRNWNLPSALGPPTIVAPFWDDLKADTTGGNNTIHVYTYYDQAGGRFIVEWSRTINRFGYEVYTNWQKETFELVLYDPNVHPTASGDGKILFQYYEVHDIDDNNNYATVGIEDEGHLRGLQYAYSNDYPSTAAPLQGGRAILITTDPPDPFGDGREEPQGNQKAILMTPQPNPANPGTVLHFSLPRDGYIQLELYNTLGQRISQLFDGNLTAGLHRQALNGTNWSSGLYFVVLHFEGSVQTQKLLILK